MRHSRLQRRRRTRLSPIGYHPDDVKASIEAISLRIKRLKSDLETEQAHFAELVKQKLILQDHIREMLDQALAKEQLLRDGNDGE